MAKIQAVWAIDIGQAALKALKLVPGETPDQVVAEAFDFIEYPKILSQPDADPDELVREALATFTRPQRPEGLQGRHRRARAGGPGEVHQAAAGREEADPRHRQVRGQAADPLRARRGRLGLPADRRRRRGRTTRSSRWPRSACSR